MGPVTDQGVVPGCFQNVSYSNPCKDGQHDAGGKAERGNFEGNDVKKDRIDEIKKDDSHEEYPPAGRC